MQNPSPAKGCVHIVFLSKGGREQRIPAAAFSGGVVPWTAQLSMKKGWNTSKIPSEWFSYYWMSPVLQGLQSRTVLRWKGLFKWSDHFFSVKNSSSFPSLLIRIYFTPHNLLESLQSAINSCCKKTSTYKNFLFDGRATRGLLHVPPASEEAGRWNLSTESCSGSVY